ncbi:hypothetical protein EJB05_22789, partial [Eragrostis curvula]
MRDGSWTSLCDAACVAVNCGAGTCKKDEGFHYHCECEPGNVNMLNNTKYPCVDANCSVSLESLVQQMVVVSLAMLAQVM